MEPATDDDGGPRDVVFTFATDAWSDSERRNHCMAADQLVLTLSSSPRVRRLMVADPFRSAPVRLARRLQGQRQPPLPDRTDPAVHARPLRLRRHDTVGVGALRQTYERYDTQLGRLAARSGLDRPAVITGNPFVAAWSPLAWAGPVTLFLWDDWAAYPPVRPWWPAYEEAFRTVGKGGRRLVAVSESLVDRVGPTGPWAVIPNGVNAAQWAPPWDVPAWFAALPQPRFSYVGTLDDRLDLDAVAAIAARWPNGSVVLVGPQPDPAFLTELAGLPNVVVRPPVGRTEVAAVVAASDVCLLVHRATDLTRAMSPLKLYEYLAGGSAVVATDLPPVRGVEPSVVLVEPGGRFADAVAEALARPRRTEAERAAFVAANSWASRHEAFLNLALAP